MPYGYLEAAIAAGQLHVANDAEPGGTVRIAARTGFFDFFQMEWACSVISWSAWLSIGAHDGSADRLRIKALGAGSARYLEPAVHHTLNFRAGFSP